MSIRLINAVLRIVRFFRGVQDPFDRCTLRDGREVDMWELKDGDEFCIRGEWYIAESDPWPCWRRGTWGMNCIHVARV